jgi:hypothetical protein
MKHINLTKPVMEKVIVFEKKRVNSWRHKFILLLLVLSGLFVMFVGYTLQQMYVENTFDMFVLFTEDREVLSQFWQDTVVSIWDEVPQVEILAAIGVLLVIVSVVWLTRRTRDINRRKIMEINKYK